MGSNPAGRTKCSIGDYMKKTICTICSQSISNCNFNKHQIACDGSYTPFVKAVNCKWCDISFDGMVDKNATTNHIRWCMKNPKRADYIQAITLRGKNSKDAMTAESKARQAEGVKQAHIAGKYKAAHEAQRGRPGTPRSIESKELSRAKALASPHRRLRRSIREYIKKDGSVVKLDSSWEEALAKRLDAIEVTWIRPDPIKWIDENGITHNYFPDFYLVDFDVYLDPKNPYAIKSQQSKLNCLIIQIKNLIILTTLDECNNFIPTQRELN